MADVAETTLRADPRWTVVTPSQMGIISFRWNDPSRSEKEIDAITSRSVDLMRADGYALVMSTILRGRPALRLCPIHPGTTADEIRETIRRLAAFSVQASAN
jgi:hypothetical protein